MVRRIIFTVVIAVIMLFNTATSEVKAITGITPNFSTLSNFHYDSGPTINLESIDVYPKVASPEEKIKISMEVTDEDPIQTVTVMFKSQMNRNQKIKLLFNELTNLYEGYLTVKDYFDSGEWTLYEIDSSNSLGERTLIYGDYVTNDRFRTEDFSEHSINVIETHPTILDVDSITVSEKLARNSTLDLSFKLDNINYMNSRVVRVGYLGPQEENSAYPNIEYFDLYTRDDGLTSYSNVTDPLTEKYEKGEWKLISISYRLSNEYGEFIHHQTIYDTNYSNSRGITSSNYGTADLSAGNFILQERVSGTPLIDVSSLKVEKEIYTAGETVRISVNPMPNAEILNSLDIAFVIPSINEIITIGGSYNEQSKRYEIIYNPNKGTNSGDWIIDHIVQADRNGRSTYLYNSDLYKEDHFNLTGGYFKVSEYTLPDVKYSLSLGNQEWSEDKYGGEVHNPTYLNQTLLNIQGIKIDTINIPNLDIEYAVLTQSHGWQTWVSNGQATDISDSIEAIKIRLTSEQANNFDIYYQVYTDHYGWLDWAKNGEEAGTDGYSLPIRGFNIQLLPKGSNPPGPTSRPFIKEPSIEYKTHVQSYGWQYPVKNGEMSGTSGEAKRLEGIIINLKDLPFTGGLQYRTHVQSFGWMNWVTDGQMSGTEGQSKRLEAIQIKLTGELANHYDIYYRVHAQSYGWLDWAKNGEEAGTSGLAKRLEAIEVKLIPKNLPAPGPTNKPFVVFSPSVMYSTHIQSIGWQNFKKDGQMSGTTGQAKRLEGIKIKLENPPYSGGFEYGTHVQSYGWQNWTINGQISGTSGESKRLEAIQVKLTGAIANHYDIYYRVHAETYGWLDWAKNGQKAGTEGKSKRLEGIEIVLVRKSEAAPGPTNRPFIF